MSKFIYKAKKNNGEIYSGEQEADDRYELYRLIKSEGGEIMSVSEKNSLSWLNTDFSSKIFGEHMRTADKITLARNLGNMLSAGLSLSRALSVLERQSKDQAAKKILSDIISEIDRGNTFAKALEKHKKIFPSLFISMVRAGEQGGTLAEALIMVSTQMEKIYLLEKRIRGALMYPAVILIVMCIVGVIMFTMVIPTLLQTFLELNVSLPPTTRALLAVSNFIRDYGLIALPVIMAVILAIYLWSRKTMGTYFIHKALLKIPIIGTLIVEVNSARTARTLASLLASGVNVVESLDITSDVVQNVHFRKIVLEARDAIKKGALMSKIFGAHSELYPVFFAEMLAVGEETGKIDEMLLGVANYYENDVEQKTRDMSTVIEPFLIVMIGGAVAFFAIAMISPMYSLVNAI